MENNENKSLCAKATLIEKAMKSFDTKSAQYILYNKQDKIISMFEVTTPYSMFSMTKSIITKPENQVTSENIKNDTIVYYKLDVVDEGNDGGVCVKAVGDNHVGDKGPTDIGKYVVIKEDNTPMIVTIAQNEGDMMNEADKKTVKHDGGNKYYKIQGEAGNAADAAAVVLEDGAIGNDEQLVVKNEEPVAADDAKKAEEDAAAAAAAKKAEEDAAAAAKTAEEDAAAAAKKAEEDAAAAAERNENAETKDGQGGEGGARKKKRRNPTKKGRKSGKKGRKSGKKSRKARRSRRSKK
jgi:hypothetical protein